MIYLHIYQIDNSIKSQSKIILQENLAHYLKTDTFAITNNENGKPTTSGIHFSISHSKDRLVQAFSLQGELGVDIEFINDQRDYLKLAKRYFHLREYKLLKSLEQKNAALLFYNLWTVKEAVCKVQGGRLWFYLDDNYLDDKQKIHQTFKGLSIFQLDTIKGFSLTLATENPTEAVKLIHE